MLFSFFFFFNDTATTEIYTLSLHDALPIYSDLKSVAAERAGDLVGRVPAVPLAAGTLVNGDLFVGGSAVERSEEHTSELQSQSNLVCRLLLEKKKKKLACDVGRLIKPSHCR